MTDSIVQAIRLADGTLIDPATRLPIGGSPSTVATSTDGDAADAALSDPVSISIQPLARRSLLDITLTHQQMAVVNNVLVYTLWGLPDDEIATMCKCTVDDVDSVRELREYQRMHDALVEGIRHNYLSSVQGVLDNASLSAASVVVNTLKSKSSRMQLEAAKDILDRSGHRPSDRVDMNFNLVGGEDGLIIRVLRETGSKSIPTLDLDNA